MIGECEARRLAALALALAALGLSAACKNENPAPGAPPKPATSQVEAAVAPGGPAVLSSGSAEFRILPSGAIQAYLLKGAARLTLDDAEQGPAGAGAVLQVNGKEVRDFTFDFDHARITATQGKLGTLGKRLELTARAQAKGMEGLKETLAVEVYDDFPTLAVATYSFENGGTAPLRLDKVDVLRRRLTAALVDAKAAPYRMWSFHGSSTEWGKDDVKEISADFSQANPLGAPTPRGIGGGIPVVAFWTAANGEAIGHIETLPLVLSIPVKTGDRGRVNAGLEMEPRTTLKPGEVYSTPRGFVAVYAGDFYEPLALWSKALQREGWTLRQPSDEAYNISWCGWGYEFDVTPAQMIGTIPKLKEFGIKWATLDDRWFENYGDWEPRKDTFPGDAIRRMVDDFHRNGILVQIWWLPLGVEDGEGKYESHTYGVAKVVKDHPDWLILDRNGRHARIVRNLAALCPALPEVQDYYRQLTEKFIRDWGFDGHKLDNVFSVPACYNPKHHHQSPNDSIDAMGEVYKTIFQTTRALKPNSVTQSCPCGTPPSLAWLPFLDQAVTADPVGSAQVRRRVKMYKALLGPQAAVYGDHVELTEVRNAQGRELDLGKDFASTLGTGGVIGTKFVWPDPGPRFKEVLLTPEKEELWRKWTALYNSKMLSKGTFLDLYVTGYDVPEGYAIAKDGRMYYAFFAPDPTAPWKGNVELRGLERGKYHVTDYENGRDLGTVEGPKPRLATEFTHHLLLEVSRD